eukprot:CAMPEP_0172473096 /NCGR_PEP_ID=MMETSP1065-20121228/68676_1 /TAXON_ID=265537 /ORGANISM="Amphiprora paludosa, Strain CCMP125" /LENGTH=1381 /DNA_ID=CAMNT_0013231265 /DNA_START=638 /DNA_END=4783 /DNA_ORIENTATION=+
MLLQNRGFVLSLWALLVVQHLAPALAVVDRAVCDATSNKCVVQKSSTPTPRPTDGSCPAPTTAAPSPEGEKAPSEVPSETPTTDSPTKAPTGSPVTSAPTTASPTTAAPTTASPTTSAPTTAAPITAAPTTAAPVAPVAAPITGGGVSSGSTDAPTGSPIAECIVYHTADFGSSLQGWTVSGDGQHIPDNYSGSHSYDMYQKGSIKIKDADAYSSSIQREFTYADIGHMDYHNEVTVTFDFCAVSFENTDNFALQFSIDDGSFYTFAEYEAGDNIDNYVNNGEAKCQSGVTESFFLPANSQNMKIRFQGGSMSQWDHLYIKHVEVEWCKIKCKPKPLDICIAIDISGSICSPYSSTNCVNCNCRSNTDGASDNNILNGDTNQCCQNFADERDFTAHLIEQADALEYDQQFSVVSFSTESDIRVPSNGNPGLVDAATAKSFVQNSFFYKGGWTNTGDAIKNCHDSLATSTNGAGVMVLITDGTPTTGAHYSNGNEVPKGSSYSEHRAWATDKADAAKGDGITIIPVVISESVSANAAYLKTLGSDPGLMVEVQQFSALDGTLNSILALMQCTAGDDVPTPNTQRNGGPPTTPSPTDPPFTDAPTPSPTKAPVASTDSPTKMYCDDLASYDFSSSSQGWSKGSSTAASYDSGEDALELTYSTSNTRPTWTSPSLTSSVGKATVVYDFKTSSVEAGDNDGFDLEYSLDNGSTWSTLQTHRASSSSYNNAADVQFAHGSAQKTDVSAEFDVPTTSAFKIRFKGKMTYQNDKVYIQRVEIDFCTPNSPSPTTAVPSLSPVVPATATPTGDCVEFHTADFSSSTDMDGWSSGVADPHSDKYGGSLLIKDSVTSSYIEQEFDQNDIGNMQDHSEVTVFLEYCAESMEAGDAFYVQFSIDGGPFYTFGEFEQGPDFNNDCGHLSENFFLPAGSTTVKIRIAGGSLSQWDYLYIKNVSLFWCQASCIEKTVDVCIAVDRSGSVCSPIDDVQGCSGCSPSADCHTPGLTTSQCCSNWVDNVDFAKGVIDLVADGRPDQFSVVSFAGESSIETPSGRVSADVAKAELGGIGYTGGWTITGQAIADCKATLAGSTNDPIIVLVTDGTPTRGGGGSDGSYQIHKDWAKQKADAAKAAGIQIIPVMVNTGHSNMNFLKTSIASDPGMTVTVSDFSDLTSVMDDVVGMMQCTANRDPTLGLTAAPVQSPTTGAPVNTARQAATCQDIFFDNFDDCWSSHNNGGDYYWGGNWHPGQKDYCESWCKTTSDCPGSDNRCIRLRDGNGWESGMKSDWVYIEGYDSLELCFDYRAKDYEPGEYWLIREESWRNGCSYGWKDVKSMVAGTDFTDNTTVDGSLCVTLPVASGITWMRVAVSSSGNHYTDELFIDNMSLKKCSV